MYSKSPFSDLNAAVKRVELEQLEKGQIYPVTIVMDRYSGTYSDGKWLAFQLCPEQIPELIGGSDPEESAYWRNHDDKELPIGKGDTPELALSDLKEKAKKYYESF